MITITEFAGGIISGSLSLISDAGHNFSDVISLMLGYVGEKLSEREPDYFHTFGFKRVKVFTALINAIMLIVLGILIIMEGIRKVNNPLVISPKLMLIIGFIGLAGNFISILILHSEKDENINMKAAYLHLFYDTISSVIVIISAIMIFLTKIVIFDIIASIIIAIMMIVSGYKIVKQSTHILMTGVPENIKIIDIIESMKKIEGVIGIHNLHVWSIDSEEIFCSAHINVKDNIDTDEIIKKTDNILKRKHGIEHTVFQLEKEKICDNKDIFYKKIEKR